MSISSVHRFEMDDKLISSHYNLVEFYANEVIFTKCVQRSRIYGNKISGHGFAIKSSAARPYSASVKIGHYEAQCVYCTYKSIRH